jgi:putative PIN family toxin of toxin-antitoxin system
MKNSFVFDTNTLISAALSPHSTNALAVKKAETLGEIVYSNRTWNEFLSVIYQSKFDKYFSLEDRTKIVDMFMIRFREITNITETVTECRDEKDNMFLELAITSNTDCIISGDSDLLILHPFRGISILSPRDFLDKF